jgi:poly(A) polymerase
MIKKFIDKLLGRTRRSKSTPETAAPPPAPPKFGVRRDVGVEEHQIDPRLVDKRALDVVHTLKAAGFEAYIVGGAVRDLLLGLAPKDFDVATNATPEQVKGLFRRAFIIGRRFRIVHVIYGRGREHEMIEVSTFRAYLDNAAAEQVQGNEKSSKRELAGMTHAVDASGRVLRDNVWGPMEEDAARRDFTVNAMYYDPETQIVVDYHQGIRDARDKVLRMIGDPAARYREDPVRLIRAVRFTAKLSGLGFDLESQTAQPFAACVPLLADVPQSRLFDEMLKLLQTGHALASIAQLQRYALRGIYPLLDLTVDRADQALVRHALQDTDRRIAQGKPVAPSFLLACVLWPDVNEHWQQRRKQNLPAYQALQEAVDQVFESRIGDVSGRGKLGADMREIWMMQPRFERRSGSSPFSLVQQPRFRAGFDFLRLRSLIDDAPEEWVQLVDWWERFSQADDAHRRDMLEAVRLEQQRSKSQARRVKAQPPADSSSASLHTGTPRPARVHRIPAEPTEDAATDDPRWRELPPDASLPEGDEGLNSPTRPRRRRRRKPRNAGGGDTAGTTSSTE